MLKITEEERKTLKKTLALLNAMIRSGESHSEPSEKLLQESLKILKVQTKT